MIAFSCPKCGKRHTAREKHAGRRGFCECHAVFEVPSVSIHCRSAGSLVHPQRETDSPVWHIVLFGTLIGFGVVSLVIFALFFHNTWEKDNQERLLSLKSEALALTQDHEYEAAKVKYDELFGLLGDRALTSNYLKDEIESARFKSVENNKKVETILAARAVAERDRQLAQGYNSVAQGSPANSTDLFYDPSRTPPYKANKLSSHYTREAAIQALAEQFDHTPAWVEANMGSSNKLQDIHANLVRGFRQTGGGQPGVGNINHVLVSQLRSAWELGDWKHKSKAEQYGAIARMQQHIETECINPQDREATLDYVQSHISSS